MSKPGIWMPLFIGDYLSDTMHLTTEQHGAYLLLIMAYWKNGGALKQDSIQNICRLSSDAWSINQAVLKQFFSIAQDGAWVHQRIDEELAEATQKKAKATERAEKAAQARWGNAPSIPQAMLDQCPSPSPSPKESKAIAIAAANCDQPAESKQAKADPVPYEQIFEAYAINLPELPQVRIKDDARRRVIRSRWNADKRFQSVEFWNRYFASVRDSKFLMEGFKGIGFDWLMNSANFKKVAEGNYQ